MVPKAQERYLIYYKHLNLQLMNQCLSRKQGKYLKNLATKVSIKRV